LLWIAGIRKYEIGATLNGMKFRINFIKICPVVIGLKQIDWHKATICIMYRESMKGLDKPTYADILLCQFYVLFRVQY
jgi:hypothetical protein